MTVRPLFWIAKVVTFFWFVTMYRYRAHGRRHLPRGGFLVASNHESYLDPMLAGMGVAGEVSFMARSTLFRNPAFGALIGSMNAFPVDRDRGDVKGVRTALDRVRAGGVVVLFPEGTRTRDGSVGRFRPGIGSLARTAGAPVVPARIAGAWSVWPQNRILPCLQGCIRVRYGPALRIAPGESAEDFARRLEAAVKDLRP